MDNKINAWDTKSKSYFQFTGKMTDFQERFFSLMNQMDVDFCGKTLIDIGCGNGMYSLELAKDYCSFVAGVDSSQGMLNELNNFAKEFDIKNIKTIFSSFDKFETDENFDIAFSTMSPALQTKDDFNKFSNLGKTRVYMNWEKSRESSMLKPFFDKYPKTSDPSKPVQLFMEWLDSKGIHYKTDILEERRTCMRNIQDAKESVLWHLHFDKVELEDKDIMELLNPQIKDGVIQDIIKSSMRVLVF